MIKNFALFFIFFFSISCFATTPLSSNCGQALATGHPNFCESFKTVAECNCTERGYPHAVCSDMGQLYNFMILVYWSQKRACKHQNQTSFQTCMDDWNCFRLGGKDSQGKLCSDTGKPCE